jgi:TonB family protein
MAPQEARERELQMATAKAKIAALENQAKNATGGSEVEEARAKLARLSAEVEATMRARAPVAATPRRIANISIVGLPDSARAELAAKLPVHAGDTLGENEMRALRQTVQEFDPHLALRISGANDGANLEIAAPGAEPERLRVGGNAQQSKLVRQPRPAYPPAAKEQRISGVVKLEAVIGKDGTMQNLKVLDGHPLLVPAALEAVRQWVYEPTLLNGNPVEVVTQIDVNFTLSQ